MQLLLALLATYMALTNAAPVTVTQTVVVETHYVTQIVNSSPYTETPDAPADVPSVTVPTTSVEAISSDPVVENTVETPTEVATSTETSSTSTSAETDSSLNSFEAEILAEHNAKRALHGVTPLVWNATLAQFGADYAAKVFSCDNVQLIHSGGPYGENLAAGYAGGAAPVDAWYDEISQYDYSNPVFSDATGHFTQVVWAATTQVGCAMVACSNVWRQYTICEYSTAGNVIGHFAENVLPLVK